MKISNNQKTGSALLLTLLVVSLLLVIVLSFTVYVRLQLRETSNRIQLQQARQNAKLGMHLALAQLQKAAGADQRVTATAAILGTGTHAQNQYTTGVWDTENPNNPPVWLISQKAGSPFNPSNPPTPAESIVLVDEGTLGGSPNPNDLIRADLVEIHDPDNQGEYAWWVSDEGVKASLNLSDPFPTTPEIDNLTRTEMNRLRYAVAPRSAGEFAFTLPVDFETPLLREFTNKALNLNQYSFVAGLSDPGEDGGYHHYTHRATGLLTRPEDGGIKKDLSLAPSLLGAGFEQFMDFNSYLVDPDVSNPIITSESDLRRAHRITPPTANNPADGDIVHSVTPVITDFGLQFSPRRESSSDGTASLMMAVILELWNPYTTALAEEDLILEISGFQPFEMELRDALDTVVWSDTFEPVEVFGNTVSMRLTREQFHTSTYVEDNSYDSNLHGPGRLLYWAGPVQAQPEKATFANRRSNQSRLKGTVTPAVTFPIGGSSSNYQVGYQMDPTVLTVRLRRTPENGGAVLVEHSDLTYDEVDTINHGTLSQWEQRWLTYRFRIIERGTTFLGDRSAWLKNTDKRTPAPKFGDDISTDTHTLHESANSYAPDDSGLKNNLSMDQDGVTYYFDRVLSTSAWSGDYRRDIPLFELPRQPLLSIGQLQHLYIHGMPPYSIGNPWGGSTWNDLFDDYFFSGIQLNISEPDFTSSKSPQLPHPRLQLASPSDLNLSGFDNTTLPGLGENAALALQVRGQFNLNSVSEEAWKAVLAGEIFTGLSHMERDTTLQDAVQTDNIISSDVNYPAGFTRFPQSIQELFDVDTEEFDQNFDRHVLNLKPGITFLYDRIDFAGKDSDYDTTDRSRIESMAEAIVTAIKQRTANAGRPYFSLSEFLTETYQNGEPILEYVIESEGLRRIDTPNGSLTPEERTPSWLSQADVISPMAPFLSTRSDTFTIRAYGDLKDPDGNTLSKAWCEAIVQRIISPIESGVSLTDMAEAPDSSLGRRFKIVSFKWLNESEI